MKKIFLAFILLSFFLVPNIFAQAPAFPDDWTSEFYYQNVTVERIFPYHLGYIVVYRGSQYQNYQVYIPREWFGQGPDSIAEMVQLRPGREWPSMTVYYHRGEFSHVRLRVRERTHETWGLIRPGNNLDELFVGVTELRLQF